MKKILVTGTVALLFISTVGAGEFWIKPQLSKKKILFNGFPENNCDPYGLLYNYSVKNFNDLYDATRDRNIPTTVYYPTSDKCFPLVIVSHGGGGDRNSLISHVTLLVSNGYVVAVPEHVKSNKSFVINLMKEFNLSFLDALKIIAADKSEWENRPRDISFLIDMAAVWNNSDVELAGKIDLSKIGVMGHSYGAYTTSAIMGALVNMPVGLTDFSDTRVDAGLSISPQGPGGNPNINYVNDWFTSESWSNISRPLSHHSEDDWLNKWRKTPFESMPLGDKYFIRFKNSRHIDFADSDIYKLLNDSEGQLRNNETINISKELALRFFDLYLKNMYDGRYNEGYADSLCRNNSIVTDIIWDEKLTVDVSISKPQRGYLYVFNTSFLPLFLGKTIVVGEVSVEVEVESLVGVDKVGFYIDDILKYEDFTSPYSWIWDEFAVGKYEIKVVAYDNQGNFATDELEVWRFF